MCSSDLDPCLWLDPGGRLWLFWFQNPDKEVGEPKLFAITADDPGEPDPRWSAPRFIADGIALNKPVVLANGDWLLPSAIWRRDHWGREAVVDLQPYWLRVRVVRQQGAVVRLLLTSHGRRYAIGQFLAPDERERLALHIDQVLSALRDGRPLPAPPAHPDPALSLLA